MVNTLSPLPPNLGCCFRLQRAVAAPGAVEGGVWLGSEACSAVPTVQEISQSLSGQENINIGKLPPFKGS